MADSPVHPDLHPSPNMAHANTHSNSFHLPIQGGHDDDIELTPTRHPFQEQDTNPFPQVIEPSTLAPEVVPHSTLELAPAYYTRPPPPSIPPHDLKRWESSKSLNSHYSAPPPFSHTPPPVPLGALPPPPRPVLGYVGGGQHGYSDLSSNGPYDRRPLPMMMMGGAPPGGRRAGGEGRICGMRRQLFCIGLAIAVFLIVVAIATGVGVGIGTRRKSSDPIPSPSSTRTLPVPTATNAPSNSNAMMACPGNNLTIYTSQEKPQKKWLLMCGRDYNSQLSFSEDMYNTVANTLSDCLDICAGQDGCVGAGWGRNSWNDGKPTCWLKSQLGKWNDAPNWSFFVEDSGT